MTLVLTAGMAAAQDFSGRITDEKGEPVSYATLRLLGEDSTFLCGATSGAEGEFVLPRMENARWLQVSSVGYQPVCLPVGDVGETIRLKEDSKMLDEVKVVSMRQLVRQEADRLSYNLEADPEARTNTLLDMLRKVPMVSVDGEDNVRVKGSTSFKYYRNGHPDPSLSGSPKEVLKSIPANLVKRVEVITDPGAKYDAEGVTAILNIVMVKGANMSGLTGNVTASINTFGSPQAHLYLAGQTGKLTLSGYYIYGHQHGHESEGWNETEMQYLSTGTRTAASSKNTQPMDFHGANISASYEIDSLNLLSASFGGYHYSLKDVEAREDFTSYNAAGDLSSAYTFLAHVPSYSGMSWNGRADYEHRTRRKGEVLTLSYMFATTGNDQNWLSEFANTVNTAFPYAGYGRDQKERFTEHTFQIDYTRPLGKWFKWDTGAKYILRGNNSHTQMTYDGYPEGDTDNRFEHDTQVMALYMSWVFNWKKWSARAGLRYEYSRLGAAYPNGDGEDFHRNLNDWVPSASVNWNISDKNSLKFSFATSINRPGISYLNPARVISSPDDVSYGNAHLTSARNTSMTLTYQQVGDKLTFNTSVAYKMNNSLIGRLAYAEDDIMYKTYSNGTRYRSLDLSAYVQWMMTRTTTLMFNGSVDYNRYSNPSLSLENDGWTGYFYTQLTQRLPWKLRLSATVMWWSIGREVSDVYAYFVSKRPILNLALQRSFLKEDRLTVKIAANSILNKWAKYEEHTIQGDYLADNRHRFRSQRLVLSVSYRFGKKSVQVKKAQTSIENDDVVGGIKQEAGN